MKRSSLMWVGLTVGFAGVIWLSSSTVVTMQELANMVARVLPVSPEDFLIFWRKCFNLIPAVFGNQGPAVRISP